MGPTVGIRSVLELVAHKPWFAMTGSQVHGTSSPVNSRCHMYHHCKQQAHFDQKGFGRLTDSPSMDVARQHILWSSGTDWTHPCVVCFWTLPDPSNATTESFQLNDVSARSPLNSVKYSVLNQMPICDSRACCGQATLCWPTATNTAQRSWILCYTCRNAANAQMQPSRLCLT